MRKPTTLETVLLCVLSVAIYYIVSDTIQEGNSFKSQMKYIDKLISSQEDYVRSLEQDKKQLEIENIKIKDYYATKKDSVAALPSNELHDYITDFLSK